MSLQTIRTKARNLNINNPSDSEIAEMYCDVQDTINQETGYIFFLLVVVVLLGVGVGIYFI
jgi:hypothetical protein